MSDRLVERDRSSSGAVVFGLVVVAIVGIIALFMIRNDSDSTPVAPTDTSSGQQVEVPDVDVPDINIPDSISIDINQGT